MPSNVAGHLLVAGGVDHLESGRVSPVALSDA